MRRILAVLALVLALGLVPYSARAQTRLGGEIYGAFNTYRMNDWNNRIGDMNASGERFKELKNGVTGGLDLRMKTPYWLLSAGWEPLFLTTENDAAARDKFRLDANDFWAGAGFLFPSTTTARYGLGGGVDFISINGAWERPGVPDVDLSGSTVGFHVRGLGEWEVSPGFGVTASAGYRFARVDDTKFNKQSSSPKLETDYTGFVSRLGMVFYLPGRSPE